MLLAREQAIQAIKSLDLDPHGAELSRKEAIEAIMRARQLEPKQRRLVFTELATRAWLRPRPLEGPLYPGFEEVLWEHFSRQEGVEEKVIASLGARQADTEIQALYNEYLRGMFAASGKTRCDFYRDMLAEAGIEIGLGDAEFGEEAFSFLTRVANSVHREHLLVFYSAGLVVKLAKERDHSIDNASREEWLDAVCRYFESGLPLECQFFQYSKDSAFLNHSLEEGRLSQMR